MVQVGKWQPYREISKPFEMSDFYKYSTRFRKPSSTNSNNPSPDVIQSAANHSPPPPPIPQNKGIYQPLKPLNCNPMCPP